MSALAARPKELAWTSKKSYLSPYTPIVVSHMHRPTPVCCLQSFLAHLRTYLMTCSTGTIDMQLSQVCLTLLSKHTCVSMFIRLICRYLQDHGSEYYNWSANPTAMLPNPRVFDCLCRRWLMFECCCRCRTPWVAVVTPSHDLSVKTHQTHRELLCRPDYVLMYRSLTYW